MTLMTKEMEHQQNLQEIKQHGAVWFPFNIYPCTIPKDFPQVALHWQESMEIVFVKKGQGVVQAGSEAYHAQAGDIYIFAPGVLHALRQEKNETMEYENIIFDLELLGGAGDVCAERYLMPLQSGRFPLPVFLKEGMDGYEQAKGCLCEAEEANRTKEMGYELLIKGALFRFLGILVLHGGQIAIGGHAGYQTLEAGASAGCRAFWRSVAHRGGRRALWLQQEPFYEMVSENDGSEFCHLSKRTTPECLRIHAPFGRLHADDSRNCRKMWV